MGVITDASPKGWGAVLMKVDETGKTRLRPLEAVEGLISKNEAELLEVEWGESSPKAVMEAVAVLRAVNMWGPKFRGRAIFIRSDSSI